MYSSGWMVGGAAVLLAAGIVGCGDRAEQAAAPPGGPPGASAPQAAVPATGLEVVTLNVKGMS